MRKGFDAFSITMFKIAKFFLFATIYILILFFVGRVVFNYGYKLFYENKMYDKTSVLKTTDIFITEDDTFETVGKKLEKEEIIDDSSIFEFRSKIYKTKLRPGHYQFNTKQSIKNILDAIDEGEIVVSNDENKN